VEKLSFKTNAELLVNLTEDSDKQDPDFYDMSTFFPCEIDDAIQYINL
jgi:hypothetical protein